MDGRENVHFMISRQMDKECRVDCKMFKLKKNIYKKVYVNMTVDVEA